MENVHLTHIKASLKDVYKYSFKGGWLGYVSIKPEVFIHNAVWVFKCQEESFFFNNVAQTLG